MFDFLRTFGFANLNRGQIFCHGCRASERQILGWIRGGSWVFLPYFWRFLKTLALDIL